jgi:predicted metal-dependent phosphoesterase TrpH
MQRRIGAFMLLKGNLHIHTSCSDGQLTPQQIADAYEERGYDFIAFTDHDHLLKPNYREIYAQVKSPLIIFHGIELTVFVKGYVHVSRIEGDREVLHIFNHIGEYDLTLEQIRERTESLAKTFSLDAVEITRKGFRVRELDSLDLPYPRIASDDAHTSVGIGRAWIELDTQRDKDSIIRAIKRGDFWNCYL